MPFYRVDVEEWDSLVESLKEEDLPPDMMGQRPSGEFEYEEASARFEPEALGAVSRLMLEVLTGVGATGFRVCYDGGGDEGFGHPEAVLFGEQARAAEDVLQEVSTPELVVRLRRIGRQSRYWGDAREMFAEASPPEVSMYALEELAQELAVRLLGDGFGTGAYELYGAFTANLQSGELIDDPQAPKPEHGR